VTDANAIVAAEAPMTARDIRANVNLIQEVMKGVMKDGTHFGIIPGCPKPSLWKPGAEKLLSTFRLGVASDVEDLSTPDEVRYRVKCRATSPSGLFLGEGLGEASSSEEKYKWRKPVCDAEYNETPEDRRREKWTKGGGNPYKQKQIRTQPADVANTILKMAHKRGLVAVTLLATAASDIFTQDIEDMDDVQTEAAPPIKPPQRASAPPSAAPPEQGDAYKPPVEQEPPPAAPAPLPATPPAAAQAAPVDPTVITPKQASRFYAIAKNSGKSDDQIKAYMKDKLGIEHSTHMKKDVYTLACTWAALPADQS
jgi:hypothetical protein